MQSTSTYWFWSSADEEVARTNLFVRWSQSFGQLEG